MVSLKSEPGRGLVNRCRRRRANVAGIVWVAKSQRFPRVSHANDTKKPPAVSFFLLMGVCVLFIPSTEYTHPHLFHVHQVKILTTYLKWFLFKERKTDYDQAILFSFPLWILNRSINYGIIFEMFTIICWSFQKRSKPEWYICINSSLDKVYPVEKGLNFIL